MAMYLFYNPETHEIREVFQKTNEPHVYSTEGVVWERIWTVPQMSVDTKINPNSSKQFIEKTMTLVQSYLKETNNNSLTQQEIIELFTNKS